VATLAVTQVKVGEVCGYLLLSLSVKACGFQACQFVAIVPGCESLTTAAINTMASSFFTSHATNFYGFKNKVLF